MSSYSYRLPFFVLSAALLGGTGPVLPAPPAPSNTASSVDIAPLSHPGEHELPADPPGKNFPRENPAARSPGLKIAVGPYMSIQVNVDALGQNIVGDAANEPILAINPTNPSNMVIGWRRR